MVQRHQREGAEAPEDERMGQAGQRAVPDHPGLEKDLGQEGADPRRQGAQTKIRVRLRAKNRGQNPAETEPEQGAGGEAGEREQCGFHGRRRLRRDAVLTI